MGFERFFFGGMVDLHLQAFQSNLPCLNVGLGFFGDKPFYYLVKIYFPFIVYSLGHTLTLMILHLQKYSRRCHWSTLLRKYLQ